MLLQVANVDASCLMTHSVCALRNRDARFNCSLLAFVQLRLRTHIMEWLQVLDRAASRFDGGDASFPSYLNSRMARELGYDVPNKDYDRLFFA